ncbi:hypothetical protein GCM10025857_36250 [Alicyclobacillus contaminans]|nr:hypothetical protein GCM10025857_36250 [Alicyclobacillus contaminans]
MAGQQVMEQQNPTAKTVIDRLREAAHCALNTAQHPHCGWIVTASFQRAVSRERLRQLAGADPEDSERMYWALPGASAAYLALGRALVITGAGSGRVEGLRRQMDAYAIHSADAADVRQAAADVRWFGGMSFAPKRPSQMWEGWPEAKFVLPHIVVEWQGQDTARVVATVAIHTADELETQLEGVRRELRWLERGQRRPESMGGKNPCLRVDRWRRPLGVRRCRAVRPRFAAGNTKKWS